MGFFISLQYFLKEVYQSNVNHKSRSSLRMARVVMSDSSYLNTKLIIGICQTYEMAPSYVKKMWKVQSELGEGVRNLLYHISFLKVIVIPKLMS